MVATGGLDAPESYARVIWELDQLDSGIGFRPGARRVVLNTCDEMPHDCNPWAEIACTTGPSTGIDPGRDQMLFTADDLDLQDVALPVLVPNDIRLFTLFTGTSTQFCAWREWCERTGGTAVQGSSSGGLPPGTDLAGLVLELIADPIVEELRLVATPSCGLQLAFDPPVSGPIDVTHGAEVVVQETITVPADLPMSVSSIDCQVLVAADLVLLGIQRIHVDVDCSALAFEDLENGREVTPAHFAGQGVSVRRPLADNPDNFGLAAFDSTPGGPNQTSSDPDLLVGLGNVLILQENGVQSVPGVYDDPDDAQLGGTLVFDFLAPSEVRSIDLIDVDHGPPMQEVHVRLVDEGGRRRSYLVPDGWTRDVHDDGPPGYGTLDLTGLAPQPGFASTATAAQDAGFDGLHVVRVEVELSSSGAVDNLVFCRSD